MNKKHITKRLSKIKYHVMSPKEVEKQSIMKILTPELYDKYGFPVEGGLMDLRLGVIEPGLKCKTCGESYKNCEGHFGVLEMARPIINVLYIDKIFLTLKVVTNDSRLKCTDEERDEWLKHLRSVKEQKGIDAYYKEHTKIMLKLSKVKICPHTEKEQTIIKLDKSSVFIFSDEEKKRILTTDIRFILENVRDEDLEFLGYENMRPEHMILTNLPVPPISMRSTITLQSGQRSEDDLTHKLTDVIRTNQRLQEHLHVGVPEAIIEDVWDLLQYHISTYIDNTIVGFPVAKHKSGEPIKSISERIVGKKGFIRNNLIGKRVNYSARTVISPDPKLKLNEVGIPYEIATRLSIPEKVTKFNIEYMREFVRNGPLKYPGANYIRTKTGAKKILLPELLDTLADEIEVGFIIDRHLVDGDNVIFNRQPSLHKLSMMGHVVKVLPIKTFAINPGICEPYNADFDGDEMNLHVCQTIEGRQEIERLMDVKHQLISPASGETVIGCIQDSITGLFMLTESSAKYSKEDVLELLFSINFKNICDIELKENMTGKEIFSTIFPKSLNFTTENKYGEFKMKDGILIKGIVDKKIIGSGGGVLLRHLHKNYDIEEVLDLISYIFNLGIQVLKKLGFTMSMDDFDINSDIEKNINTTKNKTFKKIDKLLEDYKYGKIENITGLTKEQTLELNLLKDLNSIRDSAVGIISENLDQKSGTLRMVNSGSMGKILSVVQMHIGVGQQLLRGERIVRGFTNRTLTHFKREDLTPKSKGYIESSLRCGLNPIELFFTAITARDGLTDTALRTPKTGYLYRRMATSMLDLTIREDISVRNEKGEIIQFKYGEDGLDVSKTIRGDIDIDLLIENSLSKFGGKK